VAELGDVMLSVIIKVNAPTAVGSSALLGSCEFLWFLWVMPIHQTISALLGKSRDEWLAAIRARRCPADGVGTTPVLHPNLRPRDRATSG
jgi:hypothetical protein